MEPATGERLQVSGPPSLFNVEIKCDDMGLCVCVCVWGSDIRFQNVHVMEEEGTLRLFFSEVHFVFHLEISLRSRLDSPSFTLVALWKTKDTLFFFFFFFYK